MNHSADPCHVLNPEHTHELLIEASDYAGEVWLLENG
jgi:hypothetical protein